jgi:S-adenosylmethionine-diacylgycerolhomoserine-N-methlytransferase
MTTAIQRYYRVHSKIYDSTRWSFLFGRNELCKQLSQLSDINHILEIGCGTGKNLLALRRLMPYMKLTGLDISKEMLDIAQKNAKEKNAKITFIQQPYIKPIDKDGTPDLIIFSYALSMFNSGWQKAIDTAYDNLNSGGLIAVADFHQSRFNAFKNWMRLNHVEMNAHLLPKLQTRFNPIYQEINAAYFGVWEYFLFIGEKP